MISEKNNDNDFDLSSKAMRDLGIVMPTGFVQPCFKNRMQRLINDFNSMCREAEIDFLDLWEEGPHNG